MPKSPPFTIATAQREVLTVRKSGPRLSGVRPDGTIIVNGSGLSTPDSNKHVDCILTERKISTSASRELNYLSTDRDRRGNIRLYVRRFGRRIRIREEAGTAEFIAAYDEAMTSLGSYARLSNDERNHEEETTVRGTLRWLYLQYVGSAHFGRLDPVSQRTRRRILENCLRAPLLSGSKMTLAFCALERLAPKHLITLRDDRKDSAGSANNRLKYLSAMLGWGVENGFIKTNVVRDVKRVRFRSAGFHTWTVAEVRKFEERHQVGTKARLAFALLLFLGVRRGDVVRLGQQHIFDGWVKFVPSKTRYMGAIQSEKPIAPALKLILEATPKGDATFLVTSFGQAFSPAGFGSWFRKRCDEAGLSRCSAHGLRKAGASIAAEEGATDRQLMALFDWSSSNQATVYTQKSDKRRLTAEACLLLNKRLGTFP